MTNEVRTVTDGEWPDDIGADELVFLPPTAQNAALWLSWGEPLEAFRSIAGAVTLAAWAVLDAESVPDVPLPETIDLNKAWEVDAQWQADRLAVARAHYADRECPADAYQALVALTGVVTADAAIMQSGPQRDVVADALTRSIMAGYAALRLSVSPEAMAAPDPVTVKAGRRSGEVRSAWFEPAARKAEEFAAADLSLTLAEIGRRVRRWMTREGMGGPDHPAKVSERLGLMAKVGLLKWPAGSAAASPRTP